jgi:REase_MTES_1575/Transcriptional regulator, AbiEi antitoxin
MPELPGSSVTFRRDSRAVRLAALASRQGGVVSVAQLRALGVSEPTTRRWRAGGHLHLIHPGVYAVGHPAIGLEGRLHAAVLYAGDDSALSFQTAGWCHRVIALEPETIHVSEPGERRSVPGVRVHHARRVAFEIVDDLRVTPIPRTLLDLAWVLDFPDLRRVIAEADHRGRLDATAVYAQLGRGRRGSTALRQAMAAHLPELARTFSVLEERFLALVDEAGLPLPEVNFRIDGMVVDCLWRDARLVVELDGHETHARVSAIETDRRRELRLRRAGFRVIRYTWQQVTQTPELVVAELRHELGL